ncbi:MAG: type II toxin-antitoxin system VapC family toxin [Actinomycetota bacterium]|nr:type II toxin-antitoxin system VapC family toxin [Actinomycetota bacterium]
MIAYFDTSAFIPLVIEEPGSEVAGRLWDEADHLISVRLIYAEARAALAQAQRTGRVTRRQLPRLVEVVDSLYSQLDRLDVDEVRIRRAGELAQQLGLRGYDAVHLAGAERLRDPELVLVAGDGPLLDAATELELAVARI